jgi:hypothetical protein
MAIRKTICDCVNATGKLLRIASVLVGGGRDETSTYAVSAFEGDNKWATAHGASKRLAAILVFF